MGCGASSATDDPNNNDVKRSAKQKQQQQSEVAGRKGGNVAELKAEPEIEDVCESIGFIWFWFYLN